MRTEDLIDWLKIIGGIIFVGGAIIISIYCSVITQSVSDEEYEEVAIEVIKAKYPGAYNFSFDPWEYEDEDNDYETDVVFNRGDGRPKSVEVDCECSCWGNNNVSCRIDRW